MLHITDEEQLLADEFDKDFKKDLLSRFLSRAIGKHRSETGAAVRELTPSRFASGDCAPTDSSFCLLYVCGVDDVDAADRVVLKQLAQRFKRDPLKVFFVKDRDFVGAFGSLASRSVLLFRPKRKRFKTFTGETLNIEDLASFVDGAVGGGAPLPEVLAVSPTMK